MSDEISIPSAGGARTAYSRSYRSRHSGGGFDAGTRVLLIAAAGLGLVLVGGMAAWSLGGHHQAVGVPTIEADSRPLRIKPDNPGGMNLTMFGDVSASFPDAAGHPAASDLAPAAEQPDPQALLAQRQAGVAPPIMTQAVADAAPVAAIPAVGPAAGPAMVPAAKPKPVSTVLVQLAAVASETGAATEWQRLAHRLPDMLGSRQPVMQRAEQGGKPIWRVRTGGFSDAADAAQFCKRVREKGVGCTLASF